MKVGIVGQLGTTGNQNRRGFLHKVEIFNYLILRRPDGDGSEKPNANMFQVKHTCTPHCF